MLDNILFVWDIQWALALGIGYVNETRHPANPWYYSKVYIYLGPLTLVWYYCR